MTTHRTQGTTRNCQGCRYWSEMIACATGGGPVKAMCISDESLRRGQYMSAAQTCVDWKSGHLGAVDDPPGGVDYTGEPDECPSDDDDNH